MDNEVKGEGNSINYTFRMHDPRVGRFFAPDPLQSKYPFYSPYQFSSNTPISAIELEGLESSDIKNETEKPSFLEEVFIGWVKIFNNISQVTGNHKYDNSEPEGYIMNSFEGGSKGLTDLTFQVLGTYHLARYGIGSLDADDQISFSSRWQLSLRNLSTSSYQYSRFATQSGGFTSYYQLGRAGIRGVEWGGKIYKSGQLLPKSHPSTLYFGRGGSPLLYDSSFYNLNSASGILSVTHSANTFQKTEALGWLSAYMFTKYTVDKNMNDELDEFDKQFKDRVETFKERRNEFIDNLSRRMNEGF